MGSPAGARAGAALGAGRRGAGRLHPFHAGCARPGPALEPLLHVYKVRRRPAVEPGLPRAALARQPALTSSSCRPSPSLCDLRCDLQKILSWRGCTTCKEGNSTVQLVHVYESKKQPAEGGVKAGSLQRWVLGDGLVLGDRQRRAPRLPLEEAARSGACPGRGSLPGCAGRVCRDQRPHPQHNHRCVPVD